jgi:hypothetical protein
LRGVAGEGGGGADGDTLGAVAEVLDAGDDAAEGGGEIERAADFYIHGHADEGFLADEADGGEVRCGACDWNGIRRTGSLRRS